MDDNELIYKIEQMLSKETTYYPSGLVVGISEEDEKLILELLQKYLNSQSKISNLEEKINNLIKDNIKLSKIKKINQYGEVENMFFITKERIATIETNKYFIEVDNGEYIDIKNIYKDLKSSISKDKIKNKIIELKDIAKRIAGTYQYADSEDDLKEKKNKVIELRTKAEALEDIMKLGDKNGK